MTDAQDLFNLFNPFPGLRPFETDEYNLFFGREGQSDELLARLGRTRFLAVVGTSGSGKSSLVRAGLLPALYGGLMAGTGSGWRVALMRPGHDPFGNLARALGEAFEGEGEDGERIDGGAKGDASLREALIETTLRRSTLGLSDAVRQARLEAHENLLVVVDQFEELFRYREARAGDGVGGDDAAGFVRVLLEAAARRDVPVYVVITMRSDFLGDCAQFWGLPEAINDGQYLIPRMTRDERRDAITGPAAVGGGEVAPPLINRLLNDMGDSPDQLPILQHALMRTWDFWESHRRDGEPLNVEHYEAVGAMSDALSRHADEAFEELPDERSRLVAEKVFKRLTEKGADMRETRRPTPLRELCADAEATEAEVVAVVETFRREGRSFLTPPAGAELTPDTVIDISHESLIRNWQRLKVWVNEEALSARVYRRLAEAAVLHREGKEGLLADPALQIALDWRAESRPNAAWAARYHPEFETATAFLEASREHREEEQRERERARNELLESERREREQAERFAAEQQKFASEQARAAARLRRLMFVLALVSLVALGAAGGAVYAYSQARASRARAENALRDAQNARKLAEAEEARAESALRETEAERNRAREAEQRALAEQKRAEEEEKHAEAEEGRAAEQARLAAKHAADERQAKEDARRKQLVAERLRDEALKSQEAHRLYRTAYSSWNRDSLKRAWSEFEVVAQKFRDLNDHGGAGATHFALAEIDITSSFGQRDESRAMKNYDLAHEFFKQADDRDGVASVLSSKGTYFTVAYPDDGAPNPSPLVPKEQDARHAEGSRLLEEALGIYEETKNWEAAASVLDTLRSHLINTSGLRSPEYMAAYERALPLYANAREWEKLKTARLILADYYEEKGDAARARQFREDAVKQYRDLNDHRGEAAALIDIAANQVGKFTDEEREQYFERVVQVFRRVRDPEGEVAAMQRIGDEYAIRVLRVATQRDALEAALSYYERAAAILEAEGQRDRLAELLHRMASHALSVASSTGRDRHRRWALDRYRRALTLYRAANNRRAEKEALGGVAASHQLLGQLPEAAEAYKQLAASESEPEAQANALRHAAELQKQLKSPEAIETFGRILDIYRARGERLMQAVTLTSIGTVQVELGRPAEAVESFNRALALQEGSNDKYGRANALYGLGTAHEALKQLPQALDSFERATVLFKQTNNGERAAEAYEKTVSIRKLLEQRP